MKARAKWAEKQTKCWLCGKQAWEVFPPKLTTHEIIRGVNRKKGLNIPGAWIRCCQHCHGIIDGWPIAKQYALKKIMDGKNYNRELCNVARGRQPESITEEEVMAEVAKLIWMELK